MITKILISSVMSYLLMLMIVPYFRRLAIHLSLLDYPSEERKTHVENIPLIGGACIGVSMLSVLYLNLSTFKMDQTFITPLLIGGVILLITGIVDDKINLSAFLKLGLQFICAYFLVADELYLNQSMALVGLEGLSIELKKLITLFFIVGVVNAYNLIDGIDGLAGSLFILGFAWFGLLSLILGSYPMALLCFIAVGALKGFLKFNLSDKAKIFMGDSGSLFLGFLLAGIAISLIESSYNLAHSNTLILSILSLILLPIIDELRVFFQRMKNGKSPFSADRTHIHHLILEIDNDHSKVKKWIVIIVGFSFLSNVIIAYFAGLYAAMVWSGFYYTLVYNIISFHTEMVSSRAFLMNLESA